MTQEDGRHRPRVELVGLFVLGVSTVDHIQTAGLGGVG